MQLLILFQLKSFFINVRKLSDYFLSNLNKLKQKYPKIIKEIRGRGFLIGIQLHKNQLNLLVN